MTSEPAVDGLPRRLLRVSLLFAGFVVYSAMQSPVPGVNEPHYLAKARHYWQPEWCAGDLFLESANAHLFFYQTVGWLTCVSSLERAAWFGRILGLLLLAVGWDELFSRLLRARSGSLHAAGIFLLLHTIGNFSGEWLVGGVEAKVFSYGFVFWGCGCLLRGSAPGAAACFGLAVSMHPVVGGWAMLGVVVATAIMARTASSPEVAALLHSLRPPRGLLPGVVFVVLSLPGLAPVVQMLLASDPQLARNADFIQFTYRLPHHLDPQAFSRFSYWYYAVMIVAWLTIVIARRLRPAHNPWSWRMKWFQWLVATMLVVAGVGCLVGLGPRPLPVGDVRLTLLKFYPFRLADLLLPLLMAVLVVWLTERMAFSSTCSRRRLAAVSAGFGMAYVGSLLIPGLDRNPSGMDPDTRRQWLDVCEWVRDETPDESIVYAVKVDWALRWYGERPVYVSFKDCPQDAAGIVEWHERRWRLARWWNRAFADGIADAEELQELHEATGISYLVAPEFSELNSPPVYHNETFYVYSVGREHVRTGIQGD